MTASLELSHTVHCQLDRLVNAVPALEFTEEGHISDPLLAQIRSTAATMSELTESAARLRGLLDDPGYAVVQNLVPCNTDETAALLRAACFNVLLGSPFHMIQSYELWEPLGVNFDADSFRANGTGNNPLHIDGVNTTYPPDYLILLCLRPDPAGGGANVVANLQRAVSRLSDSEVAELQQPVFEEGEFYGIVGVGPELRPFPVLQRQSSGYWEVRVSGKMLPVMQPGRPRDLIARLVDELDNDRMRVPLGAGEALYVNQLHWAHGREPLGADQEAVSPHRHRHFQQSFVRATPLQAPTS